VYRLTEIKREDRGGWSCVIKEVLGVAQRVPALEVSLRHHSGRSVGGTVPACVQRVQWQLCARLFWDFLSAINQTSDSPLSPHHPLIADELPFPSPHFHPTCDMSHQSASNFTALFESALEEYAGQTGKPWAEHPLAKQLEQCYSLESVSHVLEERAHAFTRSRGDDSRIVKSLKSVISILYTLSTNSILCDAISVPFPPAKPIFIAFAILLGAAKDISPSHDALANLLESIEQFVDRLEIYTKVTLERAMVKLIVKTMVQLLHVLGLVTKEIKRNSLTKFVKSLSGKGDIELALQKLNQLTLVEGPTTTAQILKHTDSLVQDGKAMRHLLQQMASDKNKTRPVEQGLTAVAQYSYEAAEDNELSLVEGELIVGIVRPDTHWWCGSRADGTRAGLFPAADETRA